MPKGKLIALEGIDGSGTTTLATGLKKQLSELGHKSYVTAEPSNGPVGLLIRQALRGETILDDQTLALLFAADRLDHLEKEVLPQIEQGNLVLSDRYVMSSLAYQSQFLDLETVRSFNSLARKPDLSILLELSAETAAARREIRDEAPERFDALERQKLIAKAYKEIATHMQTGLTLIIDAEGPKETVGQQALEAILEQL